MAMTKPNIIFILIDDMGWRDLGCYGSSFYETPNIDRLRAEGMLFTDAYASCPVCSPTRASVMTGKYPATVGITNFIGGARSAKLLCAPYTRYLPLTEKSIASTLRDNGYQTWHVGKWHLGEEEYWPLNHGFDVNVAGCHMGHPKHGYFSPWNIPTLEDGPEGEYLTDRITTEAIDLMKKRDNKPFFLNMCYYSVHTPIQAKPQYIEKFEQKAAEMGLDQVEAIVPGELFAWAQNENACVKRRVVQSDPKYAAMIYSLDENIGRLLDTVDEIGERDNTLVIFTSDNGGLATSEGSPTCNSPLAEGKGWMYDGGTREPLLVRWPGQVEAQSTCDVPITTPDFYPTFLEMAGIPPMPEQHCDGVSILSLFKGATSLDREAIYWHYPHYSNQGGRPGSSMRMGDYKLIEFFEDGKVELYNLRDDISEDNDLSGEMPELAAKMKEMLADWRVSVEAKIPQPNPDYCPPENA